MGDVLQCRRRTSLPRLCRSAAHELNQVVGRNNDGGHGLADALVTASSSACRGDPIRCFSARTAALNAPSVCAYCRAVIEPRRCSADSADSTATGGGLGLRRGLDVGRRSSAAPQALGGTAARRCRHPRGAGSDRCPLGDGRVPGRYPGRATRLHRAVRSDHRRRRLTSSPTSD